MKTVGRMLHSKRMGMLLCVSQKVVSKVTDQPLNLIKGVNTYRKRKMYSHGMVFNEESE